MIRENQNFFNTLNIAVDAVLIFVSMLFGYWIRFTLFPGSEQKLPFSYYLASVLCLIPVQLVIYNQAGLYEAMRKRRGVYELGRLFLANALGFALLLMGFFLLKLGNVSRGALTIFFVLENILLGFKRAVIRLYLRSIRKKGFNQKSVLIIGSGKMARHLEREIASSPELGYRVLGYAGRFHEGMTSVHLGEVSDVYDILEKAKPDEVFGALEAQEYPDLPDVIQSCNAFGLRFSLIPCYATYIPMRPYVDSLNGIPLMNLRYVPLDNKARAAAKRAVDVFGAVFLLVLTSPLMLATAIGVKLSSPGPILFRQERVGRNNKTFCMYKFRSMRVNASETTGWSTNADPRRTRFGAFIRKYSIDELPQFFNVLRGDMSLVGPRPELPHFVERFREDIPLYMVKHQVRPGITGWAQIHGFRGDTSVAKRIKYDIYYIENWSLLLDIQILLRTLRHVKNDEELV